MVANLLNVNSFQVLPKGWQLIDSIMNAKFDEEVLIYDFYLKEWKPGIVVGEYYQLGRFVEVVFSGQSYANIRKRMVFVEEHLAVMTKKVNM
jgi:hypothetical protein